MPASILVVDRDPAICLMLREFFEGEGFVVTCEPDEASAWAAIQRGRFSAVVLERAPFGEYGIHLSGRLAEEYPDLPVVVITLSPDPSPTFGHPVLAMPFDLEELLEAVEDAIGRPERVVAS